MLRKYGYLGACKVDPLVHAHDTFHVTVLPLRWSNYPTLPDSRISLVALQPTHLFFGFAGLRFLRPLCAAFSYQATASHWSPDLESERRTF